MIWFKRTPKMSNPEFLDALRTLARNMQISHTVAHTITYMPKPRPTMLTIHIINHEGAIYQLPPVSMVGQSTIPVNLPIEWLTGRPEDAAKLPPAQIRLYYD